MSNPDHDPISPSNISAHVIGLIIAVVGGCAIEWIKHKFEPPLVTSAMLGVGELTLFIYMVGGLGKAFWWTVEQWTSGRRLTHISIKELLKQFAPTKIDILNSLKPSFFITRILAFLLALIIVLLLFELFSNSAYFYLGNSNQGWVGPISTNGSTSHSSARVSNLVQAMLFLFNYYSPWILLGGAVLTTVLVVIALLTIGFRVRRSLT